MTSIFSKCSKDKILVIPCRPISFLPIFSKFLSNCCWREYFHSYLKTASSPTISLNLTNSILTKSIGSSWKLDLIWKRGTFSQTYSTTSHSHSICDMGLGRFIASEHSDYSGSLYPTTPSNGMSRIRLCIRNYALQPKHIRTKYMMRPYA